MKRILILVLCCVCRICIAQTDFINKWEQQALSRGSRWNYETQRAAAAYNYTYTSLYVNGRFVASFRDAGTCRSKITELKQLAEQIYNQNIPPPPKQSSGEINLKGPATQQLLRSAGVSEQEARRQLQSIDNGLNNAYNATKTQKKQEQLSKIDGLCACRTEQNPNYDPNANMYSTNNDLFDFPNNERNDGNDQSNILFDESTQYDNILDALEATSIRNKTSTTQTNQPITVNFDDIMNNGRPYLNPVQKERELDKSKRAYEIAIDKITNYEKNKRYIKTEINELENKLQRNNERIFELKKDSAKFYYKETVVWYEATNHGTDAEKAVVIKVENDLKNIYGLSAEEIKQLRDEAKTDLKKGVPTLKSMETEKGDVQNTQDYSEYLEKDKSTGEYKVKEIEGSKTLDATGAALSGLEIGTPIMAGLFESVHSEAKHRVSKDIEKYTEFSQSYTNSIELKQQQLIEMTKERNDLQKVFEKYGYDIINDKDDYRIINFGNECRSALRIRIE